MPTSEVEVCPYSNGAVNLYCLFKTTGTYMVTTTIAGTTMVLGANAFQSTGAAQSGSTITDVSNSYLTGTVADSIINSVAQIIVTNVFSIVIVDNGANNNTMWPALQMYNMTSAATVVRADVTITRLPGLLSAVKIRENTLKNSLEKLNKEVQKLEEMKENLSTPRNYMFKDGGAARASSTPNRATLTMFSTTEEQDSEIKQNFSLPTAQQQEERWRTYVDNLKATDPETWSRLNATTNQVRAEAMASRTTTTRDSSRERINTPVSSASGGWSNIPTPK